MACESSLDSSFEFQVLIFELMILVFPGRSQLLPCPAESDSGTGGSTGFGRRKSDFVLSGIWQCEDGGRVYHRES